MGRCEATRADHVVTLLFNRKDIQELAITRITTDLYIDPTSSSLIRKLLLQPVVQKKVNHTPLYGGRKLECSESRKQSKTYFIHNKF